MLHLSDTVTALVAPRCFRLQSHLVDQLQYVDPVCLVVLRKSDAFIANCIDLPLLEVIQGLVSASFLGEGVPPALTQEDILL